MTVITIRQHTIRSIHVLVTQCLDIMLALAIDHVQMMIAAITLKLRRHTSIVYTETSQYYLQNSMRV